MLRKDIFCAVPLIVITIEEVAVPSAGESIVMTGPPIRRRASKKSVGDYAKEYQYEERPLHISASSACGAGAAALFRISLGLAPSAGPMTPRSSSTSMSRAAREYPTRSLRWI